MYEVSTEVSVPFLWVMAAFAVAAVAAIAYTVSETKKLLREPLEELAVVFGVRCDNTREGLLGREVQPGDNLFLARGGRHTRRVYLGRVTRTEPGIIEAHGMGRMYKGAMVPGGALVGSGVKAGVAGCRIAKTRGGLLTLNEFKAKVLEVRPVSQTSEEDES